MNNIDKLVEMVTAEIMKRMEEEAKQEETKSFLVLGKDPDCKIADCLRKDFSVDVKPDLKDMQNYEYVVLPVSYINKIHAAQHTVSEHAVCETQDECESRECVKPEEDLLDLTDMKLIHERILTGKCSGSAMKAGIRIRKNAIVTQLATDYIKRHKLTLVRVD